jgi:hypothetical protein
MASSCSLSASDSYANSPLRFIQTRLLALTAPIHTTVAWPSAHFFPVNLVSLPSSHTRHKHRPHRSPFILTYIRHPPSHAHTKKTTPALSSLSATCLRLRSRDFRACVVFNRAARSEEKVGYSSLTAANPSKAVFRTRHLFATGERAKCIDMMDSSKLQAPEVHPAPISGTTGGSSLSQLPPPPKCKPPAVLRSLPPAALPSFAGRVCGPPKNALKFCRPPVARTPGPCGSMSLASLPCDALQRGEINAELLS